MGPNYNNLPVKEVQNKHSSSRFILKHKVIDEQA